VAGASVPDEVGFATKPRMAVRMIRRALAAEVPFAWVAADTVYGVGEVEQVLRRAGKGYVLGVAGTQRFRSWGKATPLAGTKGPRLHEWCYVELADLKAGEIGAAEDAVWTRGLLIRRHIADGEMAFFSTWCPAGTPIATLAAVEGHRWSIEDSFETARNELGLDHNETRSWHGWHRHVSLVMLAFAMMAIIRNKANAVAATPKKTPPRRMPQTRVSSVGRSRTSGA